MSSNQRAGRTERRLPTDPKYWNALSHRIVGGAEPILEEYRTWEPWWNPLARFGPSLGLAAAASAVAVALFVAPAGAGATSGSQVMSALAPRDSVAREFVLSTEPPDITTLLPLRQEESR